MTIRSDVPPDLTRTDMDAALFGFWWVDPAHQEAVANAVGTTWPGGPFPAPGMLYHSLLLGEDGESILHYCQFARTDVAPEPTWKNAIDRAVPGIKRVDASSTRLYRSTARVPDAPLTGCYALITVTLDTPGPDQQRAWVDAVFEAADRSIPPPESGLIAAHFHLSADGTRIFNLAEWTTPDAHQRAAGDSAPALRAATRRLPPVRDLTVLRYRFEFSMLPDPSIPDPDA